MTLSSPAQGDELGLRGLPTEPHMATSTHQLLETFYVPALSRSVAYDRGVGFFTSAWLRLAATGLGALAQNGGKARIVASPKLDRSDVAALSLGDDARTDAALLQSLQLELDELAKNLEDDTLAALAWMVADELLEFRITIPVGELDGDFHDKFGIFEDMFGDAIAFHGSPNDSERAFRNYESISVYYSWLDEREAVRVQGHRARFERIWDNRDPNLRTYPLPDAIRRSLIEFSTRSKRPYKQRAAVKTEDQRWMHQREAIEIFLRERHGVLEMATGTGKTRTALQIFAELKERGVVRTSADEDLCVVPFQVLAGRRLFGAMWCQDSGSAASQFQQLGHHRTVAVELVTDRHLQFAGLDRERTGIEELVMKAA